MATVRIEVALVSVAAAIELGYAPDSAEQSLAFTRVQLASLWVHVFRVLAKVIPVRANELDHIFVVASGVGNAGLNHIRQGTHVLEATQSKIPNVLECVI